MEEVQNPPVDAQNGGTEDRAQMGDPTDQLAAMTAERDLLAAQKAELQDLVLRRQAEFDNFRKRVERERLEFADYAAVGAVEAMLPIVDDFERGLKMKTADDEFTRGMEMIYQRLSESLKKLGLAPIESLGQKFDPNLHHAVQKAPTEEVEEDTILEEYQKGYNFKGKLLRPSMVKVSVRS